jgi:hypothetical protein
LQKSQIKKMVDKESKNNETKMKVIKKERREYQGKKE